MDRFCWLRDVGRTGLLFTVLLFTLGYCTAVGTFSSYTQSGNQFNITVSNGQVRIYVVDANTVRVSWDATGTFTSTDDVLGMNDVNRTFPAVSPLTVTDGAAQLDIATSALTCRVQKNPFRIYWLNTSGTELTHDAAAMDDAGSTQATPTFTFNSAAAEHYYGWGAGFEHFRNTGYGVDHKGITYALHRSMGHYMYSTGPAAGLGYGVWPIFAEQYSYGWGPISNPTPGSGYSISAGSGTARYWMSPNRTVAYASYYFCKGDWKTAMAGFTKVSGRSPRIGKKFYGIARDMYPGPGTPVAFSRFDSWEQSIRAKKINMDWHKMDNFFDWTNLCSNPPATNCWNAGIPAAIQHYHTAGLLFGGMNVGWGYGGCCGSGCTNHTCQSLAQCQAAINNGYDWAWYDAMNYIARSHVKDMWNVWVQAHNATDQPDGNGEIRTMISLGWQAVCQTAWPAGHMGDYLGGNSYYWRVGSSQLDEALIGHTMSHCDLADGNTGTEWGYAGYYLRPMIAIHMAGGAGNDRTDFPASIDVIENYSGAQLNHIIEWGNKHYRFIPYMFTYGMLAHENGVPIIRGMMCQDNGEQTSATYTLNDQWYVGDNIITSPAYPDLHGLTTQTGIYLPTGRWYDFWADGGQPAVYWTGPTTISYALAGSTGFRCPTFVRAGAIIPLMDSLQYVGEKPESLITLMVWPTDGSTANQLGRSFTLYEDEGAATWNTTYAWSEGYTTQPSKTSFTMNYYYATEPSTVINIGTFAGSRYCAQALRKYRVVAHGLTVNPSRVRSGTTVWTTQITKAQIDAGTAGYYYDAANGGKVYVNAAGTGQSTAFQILIGPEVSTNPAFDGVREQAQIAVTRHVGAVEVKVPFAGNHTVEILNMQGRVIARRSGSSATNYMISLDRHATTMYVVKVSGIGQSFVRKIML